MCFHPVLLTVVMTVSFRYPQKLCCLSPMNILYAAFAPAYMCAHSHTHRDNILAKLPIYVLPSHSL